MDESSVNLQGACPERPAVSERRRATSAAFWMFAANTLIVWLMGLSYLDGGMAAGGATAFGRLHFLAAYLSHFATLTLLFSLLAFGLISIWVRGWGRYVALAVVVVAPFLVSLCLNLGYGANMPIFSVLTLSLIVFGFLLFPPRRWTTCAAFAAVMPALFFLLYVDGIIWSIFRTHFNVTYYVLLTTPGVGDQLHFSGRDVLRSSGIITFVAGLEVGAVLLAYRLATKWRWMTARLGLYSSLALAGVLLVVLVEKCGYAYSDAVSRRDVLVGARRLPFYQPLTCKRFLRRRGFKVDHQHKFSTSLALKYPLEPLEPPAEPRKYNVLWIAVESWRTDAMNPEISPRLSEFEKRCLVGQRHYSSGNCTRFGVFGMFYGLDAFYWQPFLAEQRGPAIVTLLEKMGYDFLMMGSANFTNPEFRRTCFVELPDEQVIDGSGLHPGQSQERDLVMTGKFKDFLNERDEEKPFFCFLFLDSLHSPYRFKELPGFKPPFSDFREGVHYDQLAGNESERTNATVRYRNSAAYVDFLIGGMLDEVESRGLLENTIVMIAGDHSQEFGECGYFGHNGAFDDWQVKTPFLFYYPGVRPGRIEKLTSHADWVPTTLGLIGLKTPPEVYSQGLDILGEEEHEYVVAGSFSTAGIITRDGGRIVFPFEHYRVSTVDLFDEDYKPVADREAFLKKHGAKLGEVLKASGRFKR